MMKPTTEPPVESTAEYREGREARRQNMPNSDNPYKQLKGFNNSRYRWFVGYFDQNTAALLKRQLNEAAERQEEKQ